MIGIVLDYASPSAFESDHARATVGLAADARRPVRFRGRIVRHGVLVRFALRALGEAIWSEDSWASRDDYMFGHLDPIITVHPDRIFFEAFSQDESVYASLQLDPAIFEAEGETRYGTTNVDFSAWLWGALGEMRTSRETWFRIDPAGFEVKTAGAGGRFEQKVDLPESWVRGFLELQSAMAAPGTRLTMRPVDLLAAIRFLRYSKAKVSPRALRYEFPPGEDARIVLEPWEHEVRLKGADHGYTEKRVIRTWGRRRLSLIEPLLPFADSVDVYLKGRALPSFYAVKLPGMTFVLGLSGWGGEGWSKGGFSSLQGEAGTVGAEREESAHERLAAARTLTPERLAEGLGIPASEAARALARLCRIGRAMYDVERREYRHRELFDKPIAEGKVFPPDPRREQARRWLAEGRVRLDDCSPCETRKVRSYSTPEGRITREVVHRDWRVAGEAGGVGPTEVTVSETGRILFGTCPCDFFRENLLHKGPCGHMIALFAASEDRRKDAPVSVPVEAPPRPPAAPASSARGDEAENVDDERESSEKEN